MKKATVSLEGLWTFIQSMSLTSSNKRWLAEKLQQSAEAEEPACGIAAEEYVPYASKAEIMAGMEEAFKVAKLAREGKVTGRPVEELLNEL